eukprot:105319-Prorocentrum_lima.AAC.1
MQNTFDTCQSSDEHLGSCCMHTWKGKRPCVSDMVNTVKRVCYSKEVIVLVRKAMRDNNRFVSPGDGG